MARLLRTRPRSYQAEASSFLLRVKTGALFMQQRTGKTLTMFLALARLWRKGYRRVVVDCPKSAIGVWKRQARIHLNIPYRFIDVDTDPSGNACLQCGSSLCSGDMCAEFFDGITFLCINFEQTWRDDGFHLIQSFDPEVFIVDEIHRIKHHASKQSKAAWQLAQNCEYRWGATGTPTDKDDSDLWAEFRFINDQLLGDNWQTYEKRWLRKAGFGNYGRKLKKHLRARHSEILAPYVYAISREEALGLPPEEDYIIPFQLTGEAKRVYQELEDNLMTMVGDEVIVTPMAMTKMIKLHQITGGFLHTEKSVIRLEQDKLGIMYDWMQDYRGTKIVIFCRFVEEIHAIKWMLTKHRYKVGVLMGSTKDRTIWEQFQDKRDPEVLIIQEKTGGESIEVSVADIGVFYSRSFSFLTYDQCRARLLGRRKKVMFAHLTAENSIDEDLMTAVDKKGKNARDILSSLKSRRR